jgi:hypothetical protein
MDDSTTNSPPSKDNTPVPPENASALAGIFDGELSMEVSSEAAKDAGEEEEEDELLLTPSLVPPPAAAAEGPAEEPSGTEAQAPVSLALRELETLVAASQWPRIVEILGGDTACLSPTMQLLYGIASKEAAEQGTTTTESDRLAITAVSQLLGVGVDSPISLVVAKRMLRSRPRWTKREAPRGPYSFLLIVLAIGLGALAGWFFMRF